MWFWRFFVSALVQRRESHSCILQAAQSLHLFFNQTPRAGKKQKQLNLHLFDPNKA